jgi:hypothetical protein
MSPHPIQNTFRLGILRWSHFLSQLRRLCSLGERGCKFHCLLESRSRRGSRCRCCRCLWRSRCRRRIGLVFPSRECSSVLWGIRYSEGLFLLSSSLLCKSIIRQLTETSWNRRWDWSTGRRGNGARRCTWSRSDFLGPSRIREGRAQSLHRSCIHSPWDSLGRFSSRQLNTDPHHTVLIRYLRGSRLSCLVLWAGIR